MTDVMVLNWNELNVSKDSVRLLLKEPGVTKVIVVDNGSTDGSVEYFSTITSDNFKFIPLGENKGPSVARNVAIKETTAPEVFLIDGDIMYVKGTIAEYSKILNHYDDAFCVGQNSYEMVMRLGHNGTTDPVEADMFMPDEYTISDWFPMSWTQYGLYRGDLLRAHPFTEQPPFNEAGYGLEDTWQYHEMRAAGYVSLAVNAPVYYHAAHTGIRELMKVQSKEMFDKKLEERRKVFDAKWGKNKDWYPYITHNRIEHTTRPKPI